MDGNHTMNSTLFFRCLLGEEKFRCYFQMTANVKYVYTKKVVTQHQFKRSMYEY